MSLSQAPVNASPSAAKNQRENPLLSIFANVIAPIFILNKGTVIFGATPAVLIAVAIPLVYGAYFYWRTRQTSFVALLGLLNVAFTGGFALSGLTGGWFAVKEAAFPLLVGVFVLGSAFTKNPFIRMMILNPQVIKVDELEARVKERGTELEFAALLKQSTIFLSLSFAISAVLNFVLAIRIFQPIDSSLSAEEQAALLNGQLAEMTGWSSVVIMVPSMIILVGIMVYLFKKIHQLSGKTFAELAQQ